MVNNYLTKNVHLLLCKVITWYLLRIDMLHIKRIVVQVSEEDHALIKTRAAQARISMREWILNAMADRVYKEEMEKERE